MLKLFPKQHLGAGRLSNLQCAIRGSFDTYQLNTDVITSMVEGKLMLRSPAIPTPIAVIFVMMREIPKARLHTTFQVRRAVLMNGLLWLKQNNAKYYGGIEISMQRLQESQKTMYQKMP